MRKPPSSQMMFHPRCAATRWGGLVGTLLAFAVVVDGRDCDKGGVFWNEDYTSAKIPVGCTSLSLKNRNIGDDGTIALAGALESNTAIKKLYLNSNNIGDTGAIAFAEALKNNTALDVLYLWRNNIGDDGATALAEALKNNNALEGLYLRYNDIGDDGATALAEVLKNNTELYSLDLRGNNIGDDGAIALAEVLKNNTALAYLYLGGNNIGDRGATAISIATKGKAIRVRGLPLTAGARAGIGATFGAILLMVAAYYIYVIYDGYIKPYLAKRREKRLEKRRTYRAFGRAHSIIISTLAGDMYTLTDWGLCKDLKVALCKLAPADAIGKPATFQLLGDLDVASGDSHSSNQKMIDTKYGSDDRERMMQAKVVTGFNFEFALVYQSGEVGERRVGGAGGKGGMGGAATNVYDVTGNAPMRTAV